METMWRMDFNFIAERCWNARHVRTRSSPFWDITQCGLLVSDVSGHRMCPICVTWRQSVTATLKLLHVPEERRCHYTVEASLKSNAVLNMYVYTSLLACIRVDWFSWYSLVPPVNAGTVILAFMLPRSPYVSRTATLWRLSVSSSLDTITGSFITERFVLR